MDWVYQLQAIIMGIVEGLTEFLPISSTGHLIIASDLINFDKTPSYKSFIVVIQAGAILAVCWHYRIRLMEIIKGLLSAPAQQKLALNTVVAFIPAAILGLLFSHIIDQYLFSAFTVAIALVIGGLFILWVESYQQKHHIQPRVQSMDEMSMKDALMVGLFQCLALIPGTSRSGATIIGGVVWGLSRKAATEFSFFLSIPTILGATAYSVLKMFKDPAFAQGVAQIDVTGWVVGTLVSFISALLVIRWLLRYVAGHDFKLFGWYRIILGVILIVLTQSGVVSLS